MLVTEKEPVQALKEVDVLAKLTPRMDCLADLGPVTEPSMSQQICRVFQEAAIPNRIQPYRCAHSCILTARLAYLSRVSKHAFLYSEASPDILAWISVHYAGSAGD